MMETTTLRKEEEESSLQEDENGAGFQGLYRSVQNEQVEPIEAKVTGRLYTKSNYSLDLRMFPMSVFILLCDLWPLKAMDTIGNYSK